MSSTLDTDPYLAHAGRTEPQASILRLPGLQPLCVQGADTDSFLQGQLSADLRKLRTDAGLWAGYHSPKGRLLALPLLLRTEAAVELWLPDGLVEAVAKRLRMFVLRAQVRIEPAAPSCAALGLIGAGAADWLAAHGLPAPALVLQQAAQDGLRVVRLPGDRPRFLLVGPADRLTALAPQALPDGSLDWRRADIEAGVPRVGPSTQDRWVAQMVNLDQLGGVAFDKGCYTGQEVVARLHYLGNLKKRLFRVHGTGPTPLPGDDILDADGDAQAVGEIVDAVETEGGFVASAVLQIAKAESSALRTGAATLAPPSPYRYPA